MDRHVTEWTDKRQDLPKHDSLIIFYFHKHIILFPVYFNWNCDLTKPMLWGSGFPPGTQLQSHCGCPWGVGKAWTWQQPWAGRNSGSTSELEQLALGDVEVNASCFPQICPSSCLGARYPHSPPLCAGAWGHVTKSSLRECKWKWHVPPSGRASMSRFFLLQIHFPFLSAGCRFN